MSADKAALRAELRARRAARAAPMLDAAGAALAAHAAQLPGATLTAFVGMGGEVPTLPLLDALRAAGRRVLLPITLPDMTLDWAEYAGPDALVEAGRGLLEPAGPRLGPEAIGAADAILVPALAVDPAGHRLGQGGGCYDRMLPLARGAVIAVVHDDEVLDRVPVESHDLPVEAILTPGAGLVPVPAE